MMRTKQIIELFDEIDALIGALEAMIALLRASSVTHDYNRYLMSDEFDEAVAMLAKAKGE